MFGMTGGRVNDDSRTGCNIDQKKKKDLEKNIFFLYFRL